MMICEEQLMDEKQKLLVTGGTGLIGTAILSELLKCENYEVYATHRGNRPAFDGVNWITCDLGDFASEQLLECGKLSAIIHFAAHLSEHGIDDLIAIRKTNMDATERLLDYAVHNHVKTFILASTFSSLSKPLQKLITEEHPLAPLTNYAVSKYWCEAILRQYASTYGIRGVILRLSSPICKDYNKMPGTVIRKWISKAKNSEKICVWGTGRRFQDFVAVEDIGKAVILALANTNARGIYNIASGNPISMKEAAEMIAAYGNVPVEFIQHNDANDNDVWNISIEKAQNELGFQPQRDVLASNLESFFKNNKPS